MQQDRVGNEESARRPPPTEQKKPIQGGEQVELRNPNKMNFSLYWRLCRGVIRDQAGLRALRVDAEQVEAPVL